MDWIHVSERLPNDEECNKFDTMNPNHRKFLCTIKIESYEPQTRLLFFSKIFGWKYGAEDYNEYVVAWQSLPEPYRDEDGRKLKAEEINQLLKNIYDKDTTSKKEKKALLEASGCVWNSRMNRVIDMASFMNMLYEHMGFQYDVDVKTTESETVFCVKTFMKK